MATLKKYMCKYCGLSRCFPSTQTPLRTKCPSKNAPSGLHTWVRVDLR